MKQARMLGNMAQSCLKKAGISVSDASALLGCSELTLDLFFEGRALLSFEKLMLLADLLKIPFDVLMKGNDKLYCESIVHCMNQFDNEDNRELILNIIDGYLDIEESLVNCENG